MKKSELLQHLTRILESVPGSDAVVLSPTHLVDSSGVRREIDVLIEEEQRGHPLRTMVECRNHKRKVGIGYIEQLVTKRDDLQCQCVHVVSRAGFTAGAVAKAKLHGVFLSTLSETEDPLWAQWMVGKPVFEYRPFVRLQAWGFVGMDDAPRAFESQPSEVQICDEIGEPTAPLKQELEKLLPTLFAQLKEEGTRRDLIKVQPQGDHRLLVRDGDHDPMEVRSFLFGLEWGLEAVPLQLSFSDYQTRGILKGEISHVSLGDGTLVTLAQRDPEVVEISAVPPVGGEVSLNLGLVMRATDGKDYLVDLPLEGDQTVRIRLPEAMIADSE